MLLFQTAFYIYSWGRLILLSFRNALNFSLVDIINKDITGKDVEESLGRANITLNKNAVPNDPQSRFVTSGLRIGTPAITTRGFKEKEASQVATWICDVLKDLNSEDEIKRVKSEVKELCKEFPVYALKN